MRTIFSFVIAASALTVASAGMAQTATTGYGSASLQSARLCPADGAVSCNGIGPGQSVVSQQITGGAGVANVVNYDVAPLGRATTEVAFAGLGLPQIKLSSYSASNARIGNSVYAYQTYTYNGLEEFDLLLNANFHIVDSSTSGSVNGALAGGAIATGGFAIWNKADFFSYGQPFTSAQRITNQGYLFGTAGCGDFEAGSGGPRASASFGMSLGGGANQSFAVAQQNCEEQTLTLDQGDEFVIASFAQVFTNRDGWADATGTFRIALDPSVSAEQQQAFAQSVSFEAPAAVPEPATWAMMLAGFGVTGAAMRVAGRRRRAVA